MKGTPVGSEEKQKIVTHILATNRETRTVSIKQLAADLKRSGSAISIIAADLDARGLLDRQCMHVYKKDGQRCPRMVSARRRGDFSVAGCEVYHSERIETDRAAGDDRAGEVHSYVASSNDPPPPPPRCDAAAPLAFDGVQLEVVEADGEKWVTLRSAFAPFGKEVEEQVRRLKGWLVWAGTPFLDGKPNRDGTVRREMLRPDGEPDTMKGEDLRKCLIRPLAGPNSGRGSGAKPTWCVRAQKLAGVIADLDSRGMPTAIADRHAHWKRNLADAVNDYLTLGVAVNEKKHQGLTAEDLARALAEDKAERRRELADERRFTLQLFASIANGGPRQRRVHEPDDAQQNLYEQSVAEQPRERLYQIDNVVTDARRGMPRGLKSAIDRRLVSIVAIRHRMIGDSRYGAKNRDYVRFPDGNFEIWGLNAKAVQFLVIECRKAAAAPSLTAFLESIQPVGRGTWTTWKYQEGLAPSVVVMQ